MVANVDEDEKLVGKIFRAGQGRSVVMLTEEGVQEVLFQSKKPIAKQFKKKVKEILKTIRLKDGYISNADGFIKNYLPYADENTKAIVKMNLEVIDQQNKIIAENQPKVSYYNDFMEKDSLTNFRDAAKQIGVKEREFIKYLLDNEYVYRDKKGKLKPYAEYANTLFAMKDSTGEKWSGQQTMITTDGKKYFKDAISALYIK